MIPAPRASCAASFVLAAVLAAQPASAAPILPPLELAAVVVAVRRGKCSPALADLRTLGERAGPTGGRAQYLLAHCYLQRGETDAARDMFDRVAAQFPPLAPHARFYAAQTALHDGRVEDAAARLEQLLADNPPPPLRRRGRMLSAEALIRLGRHDAAVAILLHLVGEALDDAAFARVWWFLGQAAEGRGQVPLAVRAYRMAWWSVPDAIDAEAALVRLRVLQREQVPVPSAEARVQRARRLLAAGEFALAEREFTAALHDSLAPEVASDTWYRLGLLRLGSTGAIYAFEQAGMLGSDLPGALYGQGRALAAVGRTAAAEKIWARIAGDFEESVWAPWAMLSLAGMADVHGDLVGARRWLRHLAQRYPQSGTADEARWRLGWLAYRQGRYAEAEREFRDSATRFPSTWRAAACLYWAAKAQMRLGKDARALLGTVAQLFPHTYYGQRAREVAHLPAPDVPSTPAAVRPQDDRALSTMEELAALGFDDDATELADALPQPATAGTLYQTAAWLQARTGAYQRALRTVAPTLRSVFLEGARADYELWTLAYPLAYWTSVRRAAEAQGIDPYLVLAVMREESRFDPRVVSPSGAVGLLQLMLTTASMVARAAMRPADLMNPEVNITTGTQFLGGQLRAFHGDVVLALAAYNGGPFAARRLARRPRNDPDVFMESIAIAETRVYVQRVLQSYGIYRWLYR